MSRLIPDSWGRGEKSLRAAGKSQQRGSALRRESIGGVCQFDHYNIVNHLDSALVGEVGHGLYLWHVLKSVGVCQQQGVVEVLGQIMAQAIGGGVVFP